MPGHRVAAAAGGGRGAPFDHVLSPGGVTIGIGPCLPGIDAGTAVGFTGNLTVGGLGLGPCRCDRSTDANADLRASGVPCVGQTMGDAAAGVTANADAGVNTCRGIGILV